MNNPKYSGYFMAITGFLMLVINAVSYIFKYGMNSPVIVILGIMFVVIGMMTIRKSSQGALYRTGIDRFRHAGSNLYSLR